MISLDLPCCIYFQFSLVSVEVCICSLSAVYREEETLHAGRFCGSGLEWLWVFIWGKKSPEVPDGGGQILEDLSQSRGADWPVCYLSGQNR